MQIAFGWVLFLVAWSFNAYGATGLKNDTPSIIPEILQETETPSASNALAVQDPAIIPLTEIGKLPAGKYEWQPSCSPAGDVTVMVDIPLQMLYVYRGGTLIARSSISSGKPGHRTPPGVYPILGKEVMHHSNLYHNAPMPFMQRLTWRGVALHAGHIPGQPASHGCIRLPSEFARLLFQITSCGDQVFVMAEPGLVPVGVRSAEVIATRTEENSAQKTAQNFPAAANKQWVKNKALLVNQTPAPMQEGVPRRKQTKECLKLEGEELCIRNNPNLSRSARQQELNRIWSEQRALKDSLQEATPASTDFPSQSVFN